MNVSVVVVTWRSAHDLRRLVASMTRHLEPPSWELIVVDNASSDGVAGELAKWPGERRFIELERNYGYGAAANRGVELASGEAIVLLNPDTQLVDGSLAVLVQFVLERRCLAGPRLSGADGLPQPSASGPPVGAWSWLGAVWPGRLQPGAVVARTEPWRLERSVEVAWLTGACVVGPREALQRWALSSRRSTSTAKTWTSGCGRAALGCPRYFCPDLARVVHYGQGSTSQLLPEGPWDLIARNRRAVLRRAFGARRERAAQAALVMNLGLRTAAKRALFRDSARERAALRAALRARRVPALPTPEASTSPSPRGA